MSDSLTDDEEEQIFKNCGKDMKKSNGFPVRLLPVFTFLEKLHGPVTTQRRKVVEKAWHTIYIRAVGAKKTF